MKIPNTYGELVSFGLGVIEKNKELTGDIHEIVESARTEIDSGEPVKHEIEFAVQSIRDLITDPERGGTPEEWDKVSGK